MSEQLSFLEPVPLNPRMPSPHTLPARALAHLLPTHLPNLACLPCTAWAWTT